MSLCPTGVHSVKHFSPVLSLCSARTCVKCKNCVIFIIFACEQSLQTLFFKIFLDSLNFAFCLFKKRFILFLICKFNQSVCVLVFGNKAFVSLNLAL